MIINDYKEFVQYSKTKLLLFELIGLGFNTIIYKHEDFNINITDRYVYKLTKFSNLQFKDDFTAIQIYL